MKKLTVVLFFLISLFSFGQYSAGQSGTWKTSSPFGQKVFVKNEGQFDKKANGRGDVLFGTSQDGMNLYWSAKGLTYRLTEHYLSEEAREEMKKGGDPDAAMEKAEIRNHYLDMEWVGADPDAAITSGEPVSYYYTYPDGKGSSIKASAYKKIIYKNIYPGIDAEYVLPEKGGVKYSFIIHPGADISLVKMRYSRNAKVNLNQSGEIEINSEECGTYLEHQPESYYQDGQRIASAFSLKKGMIGFDISSYDKTKTIIVDPWVQPINFPISLAPWNLSIKACKNVGFDVLYDNAGNIWVYGGGEPLNLAKYNSGGALQWVFSSTQYASDLIGDAEVNKASGTAYISEGFYGTGAHIDKIDAAGNLKKTFASNNHNAEISRIRLTCSGDLITTGGGVGPPTGQPVPWQVCSVDTNLTAMTGLHVTSSVNGDHDVNLMTLDPSGSFMYLNFNYPAPFSADYLNNNEMHKVAIPGFAPSWVNPGPTYSFVEKYSLPYAGFSSGAGYRMNTFNGMVCGNGFLYTYNGDTLKKWDKNSGAMLKEIRTGGTRYLSGGLDLDFCENVYASVSSGIKEYDADLNYIKTYPLPAGGGVQDTSIYDLKVDKLKNKIYATGNGYVCSIDITPPPPVQLTASSTPASCICNGTASVTITGGCNSSLFNYTWMPGGQTTATVTGLCAGTYTVIAGASITCAKTIGDTVIVIVNGTGNPPVLTTSHTDATCTSSTGSATVNVTTGNPPYSYNWLPSGGTTASAMGLATGNYTVEVTDAGGCTRSETVTIVSTGTITTTMNHTDATCANGTGSASVNITAGNPPYTYNWLPASGTTPTISGLTAGSYTVLSTDASGCSRNDTVTVASTGSIVATANSATICSGQNAVLTASGGINYSWSSGETTSTINPVASANASYTVIVSSGTCVDTAYASLSVNPSPVAPLGNDQTICVGQEATFDAGNPGSSYLWNNGATTQTINVSGAGTFWVIIAKNNCLAKDTVQTFIPPAIHLSDSSLCTISPIVLDPGGGATGYLWSTGSNSQTLSVDHAGTYWVVVMFGNCLVGDSAVITGDGIGGALYVPNAFTPNDDHLNEVFAAQGTGIKEFNMSVFDRWGNELFRSNDINKGWDGRIEGGNYPLKNDGQEPSQEDVYIWKVDYTTQCFPKKVNKEMGIVSIIK